MSSQPGTLAEEPVPEGPVPRFELPSWRSLGVIAGITGSDSDLPYLGRDSRLYATPSWIRFRDSMLHRFPAAVLSEQVHGTGIACHHDRGDGLIVTGPSDGHLTGCPGLLLLVTVADCVPVYLYHPPTRTVGLLHAGWRGTAAGILESGVTLMSETVGASPSDLLIHCGISICGSCYQVDSSVISEVTGIGQGEGPGHLDLRSELVSRAGRLGATSVTVSPFCTAHDHRFHSHRASGGSPGRQLAYVGLPAP